MAKILITGAGGTIGRVLMRDLAHLRPIGITRLDCDLVNPVDFSEMIERYRPEILIHCACAGGKTTLGAFNEQDLIHNIAMVENIYRHAHELKRVINIGSGAEYGLHNPIRQVKERDLQLGLYGVPRDSYGLSKWLAWQRFESLDNATTLRVFGCFDPIEPDFRLIRKFVTSVKNGKRFVLKQDREFSWISGSDLSMVVEDVIERAVSWKPWKPSIPATMNVAYQETKNMFLSEMLDRWCHLHDITPSWAIEHDELGPPYTCVANEMVTNIRKPLNGLDASLGNYE